MFFEFLPVTFRLPYAIRVIGGYWTGIYFYMFLFIALSDIIIFLPKFLSRWLKKAENTAEAKHSLQRTRFYVGLVAVVLALSTAGYGFINARRIVVTHHEITLTRPMPGEPVNIVFIADLHLGAFGSEPLLPRLVEKINAQNPCMVALVGDTFNDDFYAIRNPERAAALFREINAPLGVFACLGNHDAGRTLPSMLAFFERAGVTVLKEDYAIIDERFILIGRLDETPFNGFDALGDLRRGEFSNIIDLGENTLPVIVLEHNPRHIPEYTGEVDLVLMGHTHGGQVFPATIVTRIINTIDRGHMQNDYGVHFIVTTGAHTTLFPMRTDSNNEIVRVVVR